MLFETEKQVPAGLEDVVVTGVSGRLPESDSVEQFTEQLFAGVDLVTDDDRRWTPGVYGLPARSGKLKDLASFDAAFFGVHGKQAHRMDPQLRLLLEMTHEAIVDAGINPTELRGSRTGVYVGVSSSETWGGLTVDPDKINGYELIGCCHAMFPNRISYTFDLKGPSLAIDTACSTSMIALSQAVAAMRAGHCDAAVVAGTNLCLNPINSLPHHRLGMFSPDGRCAAFDADGRGYVRAEAAVVVLLQRYGAARRVYATVRGARCNNDGSKEQGITFPNGDMQRRLAQETFEEAGLQPRDVAFVEAHGTGTKVGDPEEVNAIAELFCAKRSSPLLLGSVKSNMGHSEAASGLCSILKVLMAMERGEIPANLHFSLPNPDIPALSDGRIQVVAKNTKWDGGLVALNCFGFGGANAHVILESQRGARVAPAQYALPRLVVASGRTDGAVRCLLAHAAQHARDAELHALLDAVHTRDIPGHTHRGYRLLDGEDPPTEEVVVRNHLTEMSGEARSVWFVFPGIGSHRADAARTLLAVPAFAASVARSAYALQPLGIDLAHVLSDAPDAAFDDIINSFVSITAVQVALVDVLHEVGITPDGILGHSFGEIGCAYADGSLSAEQAVLAAYWRGRCIKDAALVPGAMAAVGLSLEECGKRLPPDVVIASHNAPGNVTIAGPVASVEKVVCSLTAAGVFATPVASAGVAFHSPYIAAAAPLLRARLEAVIPGPRPRSQRWVSSSLPRDQWDSEQGKLCDASYFVNNLLSPVLVAEALEAVPARALLVEIAPHALLQTLLRRAMPHAAIVPLASKHAPHAARHLLAAIGKIYANGAHPQVGKLYPAVSFPVSRGTPGLASWVRWDHSAQWTVTRFDGTARCGGSVVEIDLSKPKDEYLAGHNIDSRIVFPASGYLTLVWQKLANLHGKKVEEFAVVFEDVQFKRATIMKRDTPVRFLINVFDGSGAFEVCEGGSVVASGVVRPAGADDVRLALPEGTGAGNDPQLATDDIYRELRLRGYHYTGAFCGLQTSDMRGSYGTIASDDNWVTFMDNMLQFNVLGVETRELYIPTQLQRALIDPVTHAKATLASEKRVLPIRVLREFNVISAGGVEFRGVKMSLTPRSNPQRAPTLEKHEFVPYDNTGAGLDALAVSVHLALELVGSLRLRVAEAASDTLLLPAVLALLTAQPEACVDAELHAGHEADEYRTALKDLEIKVDSIDPSGDWVRYAHLALARGAAALALGSWLSPSGLLLIEAPVGLIDQPTTQRSICDIGLLLVSRQVGAGCEYLLLKKKPSLPVKSVVIELVDDGQYLWVDNLRGAMARAEKEDIRVYAVARTQESGALGLAACLRGEAGSSALRVFLAPDELAVFDARSGPFAEQAQKDLPVNVLRAGVWGSYRHLPLRSQQRSQAKVEHAFVNTLKRGDLSSLRWIESPMRWANVAPQRPNSELCRVYYAPLNFRDVMLATGKLPPDALSGSLAGQECILGLEFSGRGTDRRRVMGMVTARGLATTVLADSSFLWPVPDAWSLEEAATVPVVYATAYYALSVRGRIQRGESVLIHSGAGGVGQAAIAVALHAGCTVFTTVSTAEKRAFLLDRFPSLSDNHIGNSRDTSFEQLVLARTKGRGVDLVLNSLAADKLLASVRCLASGGRFLEIGKLDLSNNSQLGMEMFLKNTTFHGILLDALYETDATNAERLAVARCVAEGIAGGAVRPLPRTIYATHQLEEAFRYIAAGKHIGKVLLRVRTEEAKDAGDMTNAKDVRDAGGAGVAGNVDVTKKSGNLVDVRNARDVMNIENAADMKDVGGVQHALLSALPRTYFHPGRSYVVLGGLGGVGLELAFWMATRGARALVLASRAPPRTGYQSWLMRRWREQGIQVLVSTKDCSTPSGARDLLREAARLAPVGGVFNLAAVLRNAFLENLKPEDFRVVAKPKVDVTRALDVATRELCPELQYFVVFSSVACGRGGQGQSSYGLANSAMERCVERRRADGLPGLAVQWGPILEVGMVWNMRATEDTELLGTVPQRVRSCMEALDEILPSLNAVVSCLVLADKTNRPEADDDGGLPRVVANILGITDAAQVPPSTRLADLGMDSLMAAEVTQALRMRGHPHSAREVRALTFAALAQYSTC